jgi:hypothetical protein
MSRASRKWAEDGGPPNPVAVCLRSMLASKIQPFAISADVQVRFARNEIIARINS